MIPKGTVVKFRPTGHADHVYHVRVNGSPQHTFTSQAGVEYTQFGGVRVRPADLSVSFGHQHIYTARTDGLAVVSPTGDRP